jgi:hypothetical protein
MTDMLNDLRSSWTRVVVTGLWAIGLLGYWAIGLLGYWAIGKYQLGAKSYKLLILLYLGQSVLSASPSVLQYGSA